MWGSPPHAIHRLAKTVSPTLDAKSLMSLRPSASLFHHSRMTAYQTYTERILSSITRKSAGTMIGMPSNGLRTSRSSSPLSICQIIRVSTGVPSGGDGVVPLAVEGIALDVQCRHLLIRHLAPR